MGVATSVFLVEALNLLRKFSILTSATYWYLVVGLDSTKDIQWFSEAQGTEYISELQKMCFSYVRGCDKLCRLSETARPLLDKSNLNRRIELYVHSITSLGHVMNFSELVFEAAQQPLKKVMNRSRSHLINGNGTWYD